MAWVPLPPLISRGKLHFRQRQDSVGEVGHEGPNGYRVSETSSVGCEGAVEERVAKALHNWPDVITLPLQERVQALLEEFGHRWLEERHPEPFEAGAAKDCC